MANLVETGLCEAGEQSSALGFSHRNINRYAKQLREKGMASFFQKTDRRGKCFQLTEDKKQKIQTDLNEGYSNVQAGKRAGLSEGAIRYHIKNEHLSKKTFDEVEEKVETLKSSIPSERNYQDILAGESLGIGATHITERIAAIHHLLDKTPISFEPCQSVDYGGVLFLIPFLSSQGLFEYKHHYSPLSKGYYDLDFIILQMAFMYLLRIKNPEQLKHYKPGEFGKIMGVDRMPEVRCLRAKLKEIISQQKAESWNQVLAELWINRKDCVIFYVDGHIDVYYGHKANLGKNMWQD